MIVEEQVPGVRVLFDNVVNLVPFECAIQPRCRALRCPVAISEARDHRTGTIQDRVDVIRDVAVDAPGGPESDC